jgi:DNA mismatch repair protein MutS
MHNISQASFKKFIYLFFFITVLFSYKTSLHTYSYHQSETIWNAIINHYSPALNNPTLTDAEITSVINPENPHVIDRNKIKDIINKKRQINDNKKTLISLFCNSSEKKDQQEHIITQTLWKNLELFCGESEYASNLLAKIDNTISQAGSVILAKMMVEPTSNISELQRRQNIIKELVENETLYKKLQKSVYGYAKIETDLLTFWNNKVFNHLFNSSFYFPPFPLNKLPDTLLNTILPQQIRERFNQSQWMLEGLTLLNNIMSFRSISLDLRSPFIYSDYFKQDKKKFYHTKNNLTFHFNGIMNPNASPQEKLINGLSVLWNGIWCTWYLECIGWDLAQIPLGPLSAWNTLEGEWKKLKILKHAYSKLQSAAKTIHTMIDIQKNINDNTQLKNNIVCTNNIKFLLEETSSNSKEFDKMLNNLKTSAFDEDAKLSILSRGKVLATSYLMVKTQDQLIDILSAIGQIDVYLSLAKLYKESLYKNASYCFAQYAEQDTPYISIKEFWTPFIPQTKVVTNSIELGAQNTARSAIITGPNAGGKSTILKSITINLLFAQTFGICPSKKLIYTPFSYIDTYLNITDDIAEGTSTFKAEVSRVKELITTITNISPEKCFVIMDEMFKGTNPIEGEAASCAIGKHLAQFNNSIIMIATHYNKMALLKQNTKGIFENFKVIVNKDLTYPFKIYKGTTNQTIAIDIMEHENFNQSIINDARKIIEEC